MSNEVSVSICCIAYNHEKYIRDALDGFLLQKTNFPIEIIIHDDASTDKTADIIREYARKYPDLIVPIYQQENQYSKGVNPLRNFVFPKAQGKYITLCEGDDYWTDPHKLEKQVNFLEKHEDFAMCFHKVKVLLKDGRLVKDFITKVPGAVVTLEDLARKGNFIHTPSVMLRNDFTMPAWVTKCPIGDYPFYFTATGKKKIKYLNEVMAVYRLGVGVFSTLSGYNKTLNTFLTISAILKNYHDDNVHGLLLNKYERLYFSLICRHFLNREGSKDQIIRIFKERYDLQTASFYDLAGHLIVNWPGMVRSGLRVMVRKIYARLKLFKRNPAP